MLLKFMDERNIPYCKLSRNILSYLHNQSGDNFKEISDKLGVTKHFISLVSRGRRGLALRHLQSIEKAYSIPLPQLFLGVTKTEDVPEKLRHSYESMRNVLKSTLESV